MGSGLPFAQELSTAWIRAPLVGSKTCKFHVVRVLSQHERLRDTNYSTYKLEIPSQDMEISLQQNQRGVIKLV